MAFGDLTVEPRAAPVRPRAGHRPKPRKRRAVRIVVWSTVGVVLAGMGLAGWLLVDSALTVKANLESAQAQVKTIKAHAADRDFAALPALGEKFAALANDAVEPTAAPLWRMGELVPVLGENLRAVRVVAESVDDIAVEIVVPGIDLANNFTLSRGADGALDVAPIVEARSLVDSAARIVARSEAEIASLNTSLTIPQVTAAVDQFGEMLSEVSVALPQMQAGVSGVSALLGVDGPQKFALIFLNNAEAAALGGGPAAQTLLSVDGGRVAIERQASSSDFPVGLPVDIGVDDSANQLYDSILLDHINGSTSRPDFPTAAEIVRARWERDLGVSLDGVISLDPIALSKILSVTGPVSLPTGEEINSDNVVSMLLNQTYFLYDGKTEADAFFGAAASAVFDRVMAADYDIWAMADALITAADAGTVMMWSADPSLQSLLDGSRLQGTLPAENTPATVLGVYFRDRSSSKIDYYLHTATTVTTNVCEPSAPSYTVETRLWFDVPDGIELPAYVDSGLYDFYRTEVFLYGPVGAETTATAIGEVGIDTQLGPVVSDLGRPAVKFITDLESGQVGTVSATFTGTPGEYGPTEVRATPMINPTTVTMQEAACG